MTNETPPKPKTRPKSKRSPALKGTPEDPQANAPQPHPVFPKAHARMVRNSAAPAKTKGEEKTRRKALRQAERQRNRDALRAEKRARRAEINRQRRAEKSARALEQEQAQAAKRAQRAQRAEEKAARQAAQKAEREQQRTRALPVVEREVVQRPRKLERGQWIALVSFLVLIVLPGIVAAWYLWTRAADQYASHVGLTVHQANGLDAADALSGALLRFGGTVQRSDTDILNEYLRSPAIVARLSERIDLVGHYAAFHDVDPLFSLKPDATRADLVQYWRRILYVRYEDTTGLIDLRVQAFDRDTARRIATAILEEATSVVTDLAAQARTDALRFAEDDVARAERRLREAREALIAFQSRSQILDPDTDIAGRLNVINTLQAELANAYVSLDGLLEITDETAPRVATARKRIDVIQLRIDAERSNMATGADGESYPELLAQYQLLAAERAHAEARLAQSLQALDQARSEAARQSRYVIAYVPPTLADTAIYPRRWVWLGVCIAAGFAVWLLLNVGYVSVRDRR